VLMGHNVADKGTIRESVYNGPRDRAQLLNTQKRRQEGARARERDRGSTAGTQGRRGRAFVTGRCSAPRDVTTSSVEKSHSGEADGSSVSQQT
jgi:hypothetical protein